MPQPLVTIAIISYNYGNFITQAIDSALSQTYKNTEIIVIDDGSTDNTIDKLKAYENKITIVSKLHQGLIASRNEAIRHATGEYLIQLDADDYVDKKYVEKTVRCALNTDADIVYTQAHVFGRVEFKTKYIAHDLEKLKHDNYIHASSLVKKAVVGTKKYDPYLDDKGYEDWDLFLDLCMDGAKAVLLDEALLHYRKHKQSRTDKVSLNKDVLARHHILSKQNQKHPSEFWYFSSQINIFLDTIKLYNSHEAIKYKVAQQSKKIKSVEKDNVALRMRVDALEKRDISTIIKRAISRISNR